MDTVTTVMHATIRTQQINIIQLALGHQRVRLDDGDVWVWCSKEYGHEAYVETGGAVAGHWVDVTHVLDGMVTDPYPGDEPTDPEKVMLLVRATWGDALESECAAVEKELGIPTGLLGRHVEELLLTEAEAAI